MTAEKKPRKDKRTVAERVAKLIHCAEDREAQALDFRARAEALANSERARLAAEMAALPPLPTE